MKCPYCETLISLPGEVRDNVRIYRASQVIPTPCCHKGILVSAIDIVQIQAHVGPTREDNWGDVISPSTRDEVNIISPQCG